MKKLFFALIATLAVSAASAQDWGPEWGDTPEKRLENVQYMNFLRDYITRGEWGMAAHFLHVLERDAPAANPRLYSMAMDMYNKRAEAATDPAQKTMLADSLILMADKYIEVFSEKYPDNMPAIWNNRAIFTNKYFGDDKARVLEAFREGADVAGAKMPTLLVGYFAELTAAHAREDISDEDYMAVYNKIDGELATVEAPEEKNQLQSLFAGSGLATCENIEKVYGALVAASPEDAELLDRTIAILNHMNCRGAFYLSVAEKYHKVKPTMMTARIIAAAYKSNGDNATATKYLQEALTLAATPDEKLSLLLGIAADDLSGNDYRGAYNNARQAAAIDARNATAQYLMAVATAGGARGCSGLAQRGAYWLAYDRMLQARTYATEENNAALLENIGRSLGQFASAFPTAEDIFLEGLTEGAGYTVSCGWVTGGTSVRRRP